jgi:hypothetical protein
MGIIRTMPVIRSFKRMRTKPVLIFVVLIARAGLRHELLQITMWSSYL